MRPKPHIITAVIPDLSGQSEVACSQNPFDEIFEVPTVEVAHAETLLARHEHIEGKFLQTEIQCTLVARNELVFTQLCRAQLL